MEQWKWYVYIIECKNGTYYTGMTYKVELRYDQHLSGLGGAYTARHGVKRLAYAEEHEDLMSARVRERQIKGWSQAKKRRLISGKWSREWS